MKHITTDAHFSVTTPPVAADGTSAGGMARFELVGYTGRAIRQSWSRNPLVVDLAGMDTSGNVAVMYGHDYSLEAAIGQADRKDNSGQDLIVAGDVIGDGPLVDRVLGYARRGWKFQASIGADVNRIENIAPGEEGYPSAGRIAWALWGGDAGRSWANKVAQSDDRAEASLSEEHVCGTSTGTMTTTSMD